MIVLRDYQTHLKQAIYDAWNSGVRNVLAVLPTGMGKTKTFCSMTIDLAILASTKYPTVILVHRKELVQQISLVLAEEGIVHNIIAQRKDVLGIVAAHRRVLGKQFYDCNSEISVVSVDTLNSRMEKGEHWKYWAAKIRFWITDEAAHLLENNKWGRAVACFPNAIGLGVTATPRRLDKRGLGRHVDGVFDQMVEGPTTRWGIQQGYLCGYKIAIPSSDYQRYLRRASEGSDYSKESMVDASNKSQIVGDVVANYRKFANGKQAIVFTTDLITADKLEKKFQSEKIKAKCLSSESSDSERLDSMLAFQEKRIQVLINVDLFDEGLDVPGIDCVIMARPTMSLSKFLQMCGRGLRPVFAMGFDLLTKEGRLAAIAASDKPHLILIDHVGNVQEHGLPDEKREWTLDRIAKRRDKLNLIRICHNVECNAPYDRTFSECPYCLSPAFIQSRGGSGGGKVLPKEVDGDLELLDPKTLRELWASAELESPERVQKKVEHKAGLGAGKKAYLAQVERINTQKDLSLAIAKWAGRQRHVGRSDRAIHKLFYIHFDCTITEALGEPKAQMLETIEQLQRGIW